MPIKNLKELFVTLLSAVREGTERTAKILQEMSPAAQSQEVKEALEARVFVKDKILSTLDEVFRLIGEQPVRSSGRLLDMFAEDFRREIAEIQSPEARRLYVLAKASHLAHMRVAEYRVLITAADITGHFGVGVLLESCLADELAFIERGRRLVRSIAEAKIALRAAASS